MEVRKRILLVEDMDDFRQDMAEYLEEKLPDCLIDSCGNGQQALDLLAQPGDPYQVVLLDWILGSPPTGKDLLHQIKTDQPDLPVIIFTGGEPEHETQLIARDAYRYFEKPVDPDDLVGVIKDITEQDLVIKSLLEDSQKLMGFAGLVLWKYDRWENLFNLVAWQVPSDNSRSFHPHHKKLTLTPDSALHQRFLVQEKPIYISDVGQISNFVCSDFVEHFGWASLVSISLRFREEQIGFLNCYLNRPDETILETQAGLLQFAANRLAETIYYSDQYQHSRILLGDTALLYEQNQLTDSYETILARAMNLVHAKAGWIFSLEGAEVKLEACQGCNDSKCDLINSALAEDSLVKVVAQSGIAKVIDDTRVPAQGFVGLQSEARSQVGIPLRRENKTVGVIIVGHELPGAFSTMDKHLLTPFGQIAGTALERIRSMERRERYAKGLQALSEIGTQLIKLRDEQEILNKIAASAAQAVECVHCSVFTLAANKLLLAAAAGEWADRLPVGREFDLGQGVAGWVAEHGKPTLVPNTNKENRFEKGWLGDEFEPQSLVVAPIRVNGDIYGVISVEHEELNAFEEQELQLVEILAGKAGDAIENAELLSRLEELNIVSRYLSAQTEPDDIFETAVKGIQKTLDCTHVTLFVLEGDTLYPKKWVSRGRNIKITRRFKLGEGLAGHAAETGRPTLIRNPERSKYFLEGEQLKGKNRSMIVVPVKVKHAVFGVFAVDQDRRDAFNEGDQKFVETVARQTGVALERASLLVQTKLLQDISTAISAAHSVEDTINLIFEGALKLVGTESGIIHLIDEQSQAISQSFGYPKNHPHSASRFARKKGLTWEIYQKRKLLTLSNVKQQKEDFPYPIKVGKKVQALIGIPLLIQDKVIGVFFLEHREIHHFSKQEQGLLATLADQAAIAIENARLFEQKTQANEQLDQANKELENANQELDRKINNLKAVIALGQELTASVNLDENQVVNLIHKEVDPLMHTENMYIALYDAATDKVSFPLMYVDNEPAAVASRKAGTGRTEHIISTKQPLLIKTRQESIEWYQQAGREEYIGEPFASWIGVPMISGDQVIGVIATYHKTKDFVYGQDDLEVLQAVANQAAIALEVTQRMAELHALQALTSDLSADLF